MFSDPQVIAWVKSEPCVDSTSSNAIYSITSNWAIIDFNADYGYFNLNVNSEGYTTTTFHMGHDGTSNY